MPTNHDVDIEKRGRKLDCSPSSGDVVSEKTGKVKWKCKNANFDFKIDFAVHDVPDTPQASTPWPFGTNPPPGDGDNSTGWVRGGSWTGEVSEVGSWKYTVYGGPDTDPNDPMLIVRY